MGIGNGVAYESHDAVIARLSERVDRLTADRIAFASVLNRIEQGQAKAAIEATAMRGDIAVIKNLIVEWKQDVDTVKDECVTKGKRLIRVEQLFWKILLYVTGLTGAVMIIAGALWQYAMPHIHWLP